MSERRDEKWLDEQLQRAVGGISPVFDSRAWRQKHAREYEALLARGRGNGRRGKPHPVIRILRGSFGKLALAAAILVVVGILLTGRSEVRQSTTDLRPTTQQSPAQMVSIMSLSAAFRQGGMEGLDKQCDRALETLGPRPTIVYVQEFFRNSNSKGQERASI